MERTTDPKTLNRDGYSKTFSMPRALMALSLFSFRESFIISKIVGLSSKYVDKGGCNLSNEALARRHRCSKPTIANAISKAKWLGMQSSRSDEVTKFKTETGQTAYIQDRRIILNIPQIWEFFGEIWGEFYFSGCPAAEVMLDWLDDRLATEYKLGDTYLDISRFLDSFHNQFYTEQGLGELEEKYGKEGILKIIRPHLEKYKAPFNDLYALYVYGYKFSDISFRKKDSSPSKKNSFNLEKVYEYFPEDWLANEGFKEAIESYYKHRIEKNNKLTPQATKMMANKLTKHSMVTATQALERSVENGWTGVFPESTNNKPPQNSHSKPDQKASPKKIIKQADLPRTNADDFIKYCYEPAKEILSYSNNGQLPELANKLTSLYYNLYQQQQKTIDANDLMVGDANQVVHPETIIARYIQWLDRQDWLEDKQPGLFTPNHKLFNKFLNYLKDDNLGYDPITG